MGFKVYLRNKKGKKENSAKKTSVKLPAVPGRRVLLSGAEGTSLIH